MKAGAALRSVTALALLLSACGGGDDSANIRALLPRRVSDTDPTD